MWLKVRLVIVYDNKRKQNFSMKFQDYRIEFENLGTSYTVEWQNIFLEKAEEERV